ncbi:MAG: hypothetical protein ACYS8W_10305 [Planctomycetota bacterium]|jgi:hypothetical protein
MKLSLPLKLAIFVVLPIVAVITTTYLLWPTLKTRYYAYLLNKDAKYVAGAFNSLLRCGDKGITEIEKFCMSHTDHSWKTDRQGRGIKCRLRPNKYVYIVSKDVMKALESGYDEWLKYCKNSAMAGGDFIEVEIFNDTGNSIYVYDEGGKFRPIFNHEENEMFGLGGLRKVYSSSGHPRWMPECILEVKNRNSVSWEMPIWFERHNCVWHPGIYVIERNLDYSVGDASSTLRSNRICIALIPERQKKESISVIRLIGVVVAIIMIIVAMPVGALLSALFIRRFYSRILTRAIYIHLYLSLALSICAGVGASLMLERYLDSAVLGLIVIMVAYLSGAAGGSVALWFMTREDEPASFPKIFACGAISILILYGFSAMVFALGILLAHLATQGW